MNSIKTLKRYFVLIGILFTSICNGQTAVDSTEEETLIIGTWVVEGSTINDKWVFTSNNLFEYTEGNLDVIYNWSISGVSNSGVNSHYLEIINTSNLLEVYKYEISIVNENQLVLIYQREDNKGLGKPSTYFRQ